MIYIYSCSLLSWKPSADFPSDPIGCHGSGHVIGTSSVLSCLLLGDGLGQQARVVRASGCWLGHLWVFCWVGHPFFFFLFLK